MSEDEKEICCRFFDPQKWIPNFKIDNEKREALCFRDTLIIELKIGQANKKPLGGYCILVDSMGPHTRQFQIHIQSSMTIDGHFGGSKMINSSTEKFHCLEEKRTEFAHKNNGLYEKTIIMGIQDDTYHVEITESCPCNKITRSRDVNFCGQGGFLSEGGNILLMRYLAITNYEGSFSTESITIDGDIVTSTYNCRAAKRIEIDNRYLDIYTIERNILEDNGTLQTSKIYFSPVGKMIRYDWLDKPYMLKINPLSDPNVTDSKKNINIPLREHWPEDIEMLSKYLDKKSKTAAQYTNYLKDHPELKSLIADYVQTLLVGNQLYEGVHLVPILFKQPENVVDFTIDHFKAFSKDPKIWEATELDKMYDEMLNLQLARKKSSGSTCNVCGFYVDSTALDSPVEESNISHEQDTVNLDNSMFSVKKDDNQAEMESLKKKDDENSLNGRRTCCSEIQDTSESDKPNEEFDSKEQTNVISMYV